jgi:hypothetical protein
MLYTYCWFACVGRYQKFLLPSVGDMGPGDTQFQKYFSWQGTVDSSNYASVRCCPTLLAQSFHQCDIFDVQAHALTNGCSAYVELASHRARVTSVWLMFEYFLCVCDQSSENQEV